MDKKRKKIINIGLGIGACILLCLLEVIIYVSGVEAKYGYMIFGIVISIFILADIAWMINKRK